MHHQTIRSAKMKDKFKGVPYPIVKSPQGLLRTESGVAQIKADLLQLLLTNPEERVMLPTFGTPLKDLFFDQNDSQAAETARQMVINSISLWEPRIVVQSIEAGLIDPNAANEFEDGTTDGHILFIRIEFLDPEQIQEVQELILEVPLGG